MPTDLRQVSALFEACISQIRSQPQRNADKEAEEWLKSSRVTVMKEIEEGFQELARAADDPKTAPSWAVNPSKPWRIYPDVPHPHYLNAYIPMFEKELEKLLKECGFDASVSHSVWGETTRYHITIKFPSTSNSSDLSSDSAVKDLREAFNSLPKFSAAILKITECGDEEPLLPEPEPSSEPAGPRTRGSKKAANEFTQSASKRRGVRGEKGASADDEAASPRRTSKRLRNMDPGASEETLDTEAVSKRRTKKARHS